MVIKCNRCGACCYYKLPPSSVWRKCKYLIRLKSGKTLCRIYKNRLGVEIAKGVFCLTRKKQATIIGGCPYDEVIRRSKNEMEKTITRINN